MSVNNVTVLLYHMVFSAKYRRAVLDKGVDRAISEICLEIEKRHEVKFIEIGFDKDHIHLLVQSVSTYSVTNLVRIIKSITASVREKFLRHVKKQLWGREFWSDGYFASTVGKHVDENMIANYVKNQGDNYEKLHEDG